MDGADYRQVHADRIASRLVGSQRRAEGTCSRHQTVSLSDILFVLLYPISRFYPTHPIPKQLSRLLVRWCDLRNPVVKNSFPSFLSAVVYRNAPAIITQDTTRKKKKIHSSSNGYVFG